MVMPDQTGGFSFTLPPEIQTAIKSNLDMLPNVRNAIAGLKKLGVDTSEHENAANGLESIMNALLTTFGQK